MMGPLQVPQKRLGPSSFAQSRSQSGQARKANRADLSNTGLI